MADLRTDCPAAFLVVKCATFRLVAICRLEGGKYGKIRKGKKVCEIPEAEDRFRLPADDWRVVAVIPYSGQLYEFLYVNFPANGKQSIEIDSLATAIVYGTWTRN